MGNANISGPKPSTRSPEVNQCSTYNWNIASEGEPSDDLTKKLKDANAYIKLDKFCAPRGDTAELGTVACSNIGGKDRGDEWILYETELLDTNCQYNDCDPGYAVSNNGCNGGCCSIIGATVSCARQSYSTNAVECCFNDYACDNQEDKCFQTPARQFTCNPAFRDLSKKNCRDVIEDYCVGNKLFASQTDWLEMWLENSSIEINSDMERSTEVFPASPFSPRMDVSQIGRQYPMPEKQPCLRAIARNVTLGNVCSWDDLQEGEIVTTNINPDGLAWSQSILTQVYDKYKNENGQGLLGGISTDGMNRDSGFYNTLWNICNKFPSLCSNGSDINPVGILPDLCRNITTEDLIKTPDAIKWCGCHMPEEQYKEYTETYGIARECTPMCNKLGVIPVIDNNGERKFCEQNTCIIDDNTVNLINSEISGSISFNQICPGCGKNNVNRKFKRESGSSSTSGSSKTVSYTLTSPIKPILLTNYYLSTYGGGYARSNFPNNNLFLELLYTPKSFFIKNPKLLNNPRKNPYAPYKDLVDSDFPGGVKGYLEKTYGISTVIVLFGLRNKTDCIGFVNAGFTANPVNIRVSSSVLKSDAYYPVYFSNLDSNSNTYKSLIYDPKQTCVGSIFSNFQSNAGFVKVSEKIYNETIVSETDNKFSSGQADGKVTSNTCNCTLSGVNLTTINSRINGSINFTEECGKADCINSKGEPISCASTSNDPLTHDTIENVEIQTAALEEEEKYSSVFYILSAFLFLIFIVMIFLELRK